MTFPVAAGRLGRSAGIPIVLLLAWFPFAAVAAEEAGTPVKAGHVEFAGDALKVTEGDDGYTATARNVRVLWPGASLRADGAAIRVSSRATQGGGADPGADRHRLPAAGIELYAEGNVRVEWRPVFTQGVQKGLEELRKGKTGAPGAVARALEAGENGADRADVLTCRVFYFDFGSRRGVVRDARADLVRAFGKTPMPPGSRIVARAAEIRVALAADGSGTLTLKDASVTDCEYIVPHYDIRVSEVRVELGAGEDPELWLQLTHVTPRAFGVPFFYVPWIPWNARWRPMVRLRPGRSSEFGWFLRAGVGMEVKTRRPGVSDKRSRLGTFWLLGDWFESRGAAAGLDGRWGLSGSHPFHGECLLYGLHDRGDRRAVARDLGWYPLEREDRWRAYVAHRHEAPALGARVDIEINALGDPNLLAEFFEDEWRTEKPPESYFQLLEAVGNHGGTLLVRPRLNDFQSQVEYLPRLLYRGIAHPLPLELGVLTAFVEGGQVRTRPDDRLPGLSSDRLWRLDTGAEYALPLRLLVAEVEPFAAARYTLFGESAAGDGPLDRGAFEVGVRARLQAWRDFFVDAPSWGIHDLRHVMVLEADYRNRFEVTRPSTDWIPVDAMEAVDEVQRVDLRFSNRLQTWRNAADGTPAAADLFLFEVEIPVHPDPARDNGGDRFGPALFDLRIAPAPAVTFQSFSEVDVNGWRFLRWDAGLTVTPAKGIALSLSTSNVPGALHGAAASASVRFSERWTARVEAVYDFESGREVRTALTLRRILHRWVLEAGVHTDRSREDLGVSVTLMPLAAVPEAWER